MVFVINNYQCHSIKFDEENEIFNIELPLLQNTDKELYKEKQNKDERSKKVKERGKRERCLEN
jgi:hypothetical protein